MQYLRVLSDAGTASLTLLVAGLHENQQAASAAYILKLRVHMNCGAAAVCFGFGIPPLDGGIQCSTDSVEDPPTWGLFDIRGTHAKTPQAIACRHSMAGNVQHQNARFRFQCEILWVKSQTSQS